MFYYNVLLRRIQNRWMDGIVMKVLFDEIFHILFNFLKWLVLLCFCFSLLYFSLLYFSPHCKLNFPSITNIIHFDITARSQTPNYIRVKSILLLSQWWMHTHGKWIWPLKICTKMTLCRTYVQVSMLWANLMHVFACKVSFIFYLFCLFVNVILCRTGTEKKCIFYI